MFDVSKKNQVYHEYVKKYGNKDKAAKIIKSITQDKPSKDWTEEDLEALQKGLLA